VLRHVESFAYRSTTRQQIQLAPIGANAMRYVCLVYFEESVLRSLDADAKRALDRDSMAYDAELQERGHLVVAHALQSVTAAMSVRLRDSRMSATDGPFMETKEALGGFILIDARDLNDAVQIASRIPLAKLGTVEVRPIMHVEAPS
jgi:hypothetical protein